MDKNHIPYNYECGKEIFLKIEKIIDNFISELKNKAENKNIILYGINGHKILALMELKKRLNDIYKDMM